MTAQLAIITHNCICLGSDSAATIQHSAGMTFIGHTQKIFELSEAPPIGLMINGSSDFYGQPLENMIASFRDAVGSELHTVRQAAQVFLTYLKDNADHTDRGAGELLESLEDELLFILEEFESVGNLTDLDREHDKLMQIMSRRAEELEQDRSEYAPVFEASEFGEAFGAACQEAFYKVFKPQVTSPGDREHVMQLEACVLRLALAGVRSRNSLVRNATGLIFAGFERANPYLISIELGGVLLGQLRVTSRIEIVSDPRKREAILIPFAETDTVERMINGLSKDIATDLGRDASNALRSLLEDFVPAMSEAVKDEVIDKWQTGFSSSLDQVSAAHLAKIFPLLAHLGREDIGAYAAGLIDAAILERMYSTKGRTIGGPAKVALLTRQRGFEWFEQPARGPIVEKSWSRYAA